MGVATEKIGIRGEVVIEIHISDANNPTGRSAMNDRPIRTYSAADVREIVELLRNDPDMSAEKFSGMERLADILKYFEGMTEADIEAEVQNFFRSERLR